MSYVSSGNGWEVTHIIKPQTWYMYVCHNYVHMKLNLQTFLGHQYFKILLATVTSTTYLSLEVSSWKGEVVELLSPCWTHYILFTGTHTYACDIITRIPGGVIPCCWLGNKGGIWIHPNANRSRLLEDVFLFCFFVEMKSARASRADEAFGIGVDTLYAVTTLTCRGTRCQPEWEIHIGEVQWKICIQ